jgi:hypothetical protein
MLAQVVHEHKNQGQRRNGNPSVWIENQGCPDEAEENLSQGGTFFSLLIRKQNKHAGKSDQRNQKFIEGIG